MYGEIDVAKCSDGAIARGERAGEIFNFENDGAFVQSSETLRDRG